MRITVTILLCLFFAKAFSQNDSTSVLYDKSRDSIRYNYDNFVKDSLEVIRVKLVRPQFRIDNRNIYFKGQMLAVGGYDAGFLLKDKLRLTLGYYRMNDNLSSYHADIEGQQYDRQLKLAYGTINTELLYINKRFFSLGMPLEFGFGRNISRYKLTPDATDYVEKQGFVVVTDFGLSGTFKPIRWVGIRFVVGYRKNVVNQVDDFRFDGIFTSVGLNIDFHEVTKDFKMYRLMKRYNRMDSKIGTAVDLFVD
jgi:hypothetical protein